jgi:hypothetical protein
MFLNNEILLLLDEFTFGSSLAVGFICFVAD